MSEQWEPLDTAPMDGTIIEIRCDYGVAPWWGLIQWVGTLSDGRWSDPRHPSKGIMGGNSFKWRDTNQDASKYTDPTGGLQDTHEYWQRAIYGASR